MVTRKTSILIGLFAVAAFACVSCKKEITIQCHSDTHNLKVDDKKIGTLDSGDTKDVEVPGVGSFLIKWTNYDDEAQSETLWGENIEDGAVWHLYHAYGSFDEW